MAIVVVSSTCTTFFLELSAPFIRKMAKVIVMCTQRTLLIITPEQEAETGSILESLRMKQHRGIFFSQSFTNNYLFGVHIYVLFNLVVWT